MDGSTETPLDQLDAAIAALAAGLHQRMARWLSLIEEFDRREGAAAWGFRSTAEWLAWRCGLSNRAARDHVRAARGLASRPLVRAAFADGELSYSKIRALTRAPVDEAEGWLLDLARTSTAGQLERTVQ